MGGEALADPNNLGALMQFLDLIESEAQLRIKTRTRGKSMDDFKIISLLKEDFARIQARIQMAKEQRDATKGNQPLNCSKPPSLPRRSLG